MSLFFYLPVSVIVITHLNFKKSLFKFFHFLSDSVHAHLAAEALAGLASKEDFSNVQLRKNNTTVPHQDMAPHKSDCMLLQVQPNISSI
jgi:hypothetical protein